MQATWCDCTLSATSHMPLFSNELMNIPISEDANWMITNLICELDSSSIAEDRWCVHFSCKNLHVYYMWFEALCCEARNFKSVLQAPRPDYK